MKENEIKRVQELNDEIRNFKSCYEGNELWGGQDTPVSSERLISYLIEHPHLQDIANKINELRNKIV